MLLLFLANFYHFLTLAVIYRACSLLTRLGQLCVSQIADTYQGCGHHYREHVHFKGAYFNTKEIFVRDLLIIVDCSLMWVRQHFICFGAVSEVL